MGELGICRRTADSHMSAAGTKVADGNSVDATTLAVLAAFPAQLEAYYAAIPSGFENFRPVAWTGIPSEPFTPIEQLCHVRDIEIEGYHARFARTLGELDPLLPNIDGETLARERQYANDDSAAVLAAFRRARTHSLALIAALTPAQLARTARFDGRQTTLRGLVHMLCSHDQQHLSGMQWLLARIHSGG